MPDDDLLLSQVEDAGLNASAPPEQRWMDGWLVRHAPGKAKRARCVNALAQGKLPLDRQLQRVAAVFAEAGLPMLIRITPFTVPAGLDAALAERGFSLLDDTRVMVASPLAAEAAEPPAPAGCRWTGLDAGAFAQAVGSLRGSTAEQVAAHARRLANTAVPCHLFAWQRGADGALLACGQFTREAGLVGLYDIITAESARGQGLASALCRQLVKEASQSGARSAYLQVDAGNDAARRIYHRLGFVDSYAYHYRQAP